MSTQPSTESLVRFDRFELNLRTGELRRDGVFLKLQPQPAKVLALLVSRAGQIVTRQALAQQVWGSETFVDFERGLNFSISQIRICLEDDPDQPRFVETVPKRGYKFIAAVESTPEPAEMNRPTAPAREHHGGDTLKNDTLKNDERGRGLRRAWIAAGALSVLFLGALAMRHLIAKDVSAHNPIQSLAVLPLANLSADPSQEYFTDGLTDELITELAKIGNLRVISRTSVISYKGTQKKIFEIAQELQVDAIVEGTVERVGDRVRIRAQLIRAATDEHLWAESYERGVEDLLRLEGEVAQDIATRIGRVTSEQRNQLATKQIVSTAAYDDYLKGRYYWNKRTEDGLRKGIEHFERAIDQDPGYAQSYAGLADSYIMLANWGFMPSADAYPKAKEAAAKALELDDRLAEAHTSLAYATFLYDWDWVGAEKEFQRAIQLNANYATAHHFYSIYLMASGRHAEARAEIRRALELDPLSLIITSVAGWIYYEGRQYDEALQQSKRALEMDATYTPALLDVGMIYLRTGDYQKAIAQFERARSVAGDQGVVLSYLAQAKARAGDRVEAHRILRRIENRLATTYVSPWDFALIYSALGEKDKALASLDQAADEHVGWVVRLGVDPALDELRSDPRFKALTKRIRTPQLS